VALVAGCGEACKIASQEYAENAKSAKKIKEAIMREISESELDICINGDQDFCVDSTINMCIKGVSSEALMLSAKQFCSISNGSACTSKNYSPSYVLVAMGIPQDIIECSIRISWGPDLELSDIQNNIRELFAIARQIRG
jgi:cysteine desulfurase